MGILRDKKFIKTMLTLAIPITIQSFITSSLNLVDNLMIGKLGEEAIAAVGLANQYFLFLCCVYQELMLVQAYLCLNIGVKEMLKV